MARGVPLHGRGDSPRLHPTLPDAAQAGDRCNKVAPGVSCGGGAHWPCRASVIQTMGETDPILPAPASPKPPTAFCAPRPHRPAPDANRPIHATRCLTLIMREQEA